MALQMVSVSSSGAIGNYWRVIHCTLDAANKTIRVAAALYMDQNSRMIGKDPLSTSQYIFAYEPFLSNENAIQTAYSQLKDLSDFAHAVDC
jgi:hypothetical protein